MSRGFVLDRKGHRVLLVDRSVLLTKMEFNLLEVLLRHRGEALSRKKLLSLVWGYDYLGDTRTVDVHVAQLRKKLGLDDRIKTVYRVGYRLDL